MAEKDLQRRTEPATQAARAIRSGATWLGLLLAFAAGASAGWIGGRAVGAPDRGSALASAATAPDEEAGAGATLHERMFALDPFVVNLLAEDASRYLKVRVELEAESPALRAELEERLPQVRDGVISVLSARDVADVTSYEGKTLLKHDIQERVNGLLRDGCVRSVLFTEFVVQ